MRTKPITKQEWKELSGKAQWDIMAALRGPDWSHPSAGYGLKYFTTSVIRGIMQDAIRVGGLVNEVPVVVMFKFNPGVSFGEFDYSHFIGHIHEAAQWLDVKVVQFPESINLVDFAGRYGSLMKFQQTEWYKIDSPKVSSNE